MHEHLAAKKILLRWIPHNLTTSQKEGRVDWLREMLKKYDCGASKHVYDIVTGDKIWILAYEPENNQQSSVWVFQDEPNQTKFTGALSTSYQMVTFFQETRYIATVFLDKCKSVNSEWYTSVYLPKVFKEIRKTNRNRRITLHHDNAILYTVYSPDLTPNDFFLFPHNKNIF